MPSACSDVIVQSFVILLAPKPSSYFCLLNDSKPETTEGAEEPGFDQ